MSDTQGNLIQAPPRTGAIISPCGRYRYKLWRAWGEQDECGLPLIYANFVMLNPSKADASKDDPTIRRCIGFAKRWGCGGVVVTNVYPLRMTDPHFMLKTDGRIGVEPGGSDNHHHLLHAAEHAQVVICAWGTHAEHSRVAWAIETLRLSGAILKCLGRTKDGSPKHPVRLAGDTKLEGYP